MKTGQIIAKLRDAVQVCLMVEGNEVEEARNPLTEASNMYARSAVLSSELPEK